MDPQPGASAADATETSAAPAEPGRNGAGPDRDADGRRPELAAAFEAVVANVTSVYLGNDRVVRLSLACLLAEGHLLVEDLPGVGKTTLAKALARSVGLSFRRVQFTADLLPADVVGAMVFDRDGGRLTFRPGPVFTNVLLADELNRASPKAQSALLEAMEERQVTSDGVSHLLPRPFMVLATQNPFDAAGTFPLPHSQRDRFLLRVSLGYPDRDAEERLLADQAVRPSVDTLGTVCGPDIFGRFAAAVDRVHLAPAVRRYILELVAATRTHPNLSIGASPRATLALQRAASAVAIARGETFVAPHDVAITAEPALAHRVVVDAAADLAGVTATTVIEQILAAVPVPVGTS